MERRSSGGQGHPEAEFFDFVRTCCSLFDSLYPSVPLIGWTAPDGVPPPSSPMRGSADVSSPPFSGAAPSLEPSSEGRSSHVLVVFYGDLGSWVGGGVTEPAEVLGTYLLPPPSCVATGPSDSLLIGLVSLLCRERPTLGHHACLCDPKENGPPLTVTPNLTSGTFLT